MLDLHKIRNDSEAIIARLNTRGDDFTSEIEKLSEADARVRQAETAKQALQAERNKASKQIGEFKKQGEDSSLAEDEVKQIGAKIKQLGKEMESANSERDAILHSLPNLPHSDCPAGMSAADNPVLRTWGEIPPTTDFDRDHVNIASKKGLVDFSAGARVSGSGFVVYTGLGAKLERALINFLLDMHTNEHGYVEVSPPFVVNRAAMFGTGQLPKFEDDLYGFENGDMFLIPTAEVPLTNIFSDQILNSADLPLQRAAYTPCFRREAGAAGKENRGLIRMHQFDKVELVHVTRPADSYETLETLTKNAEAVLQRLELPYRVIELCAGDLGFGAARTYDIEVWAAGQGGYLEVSSCSNFEDFQARRMGLRYKNTETKKNEFCHTLNGSGTALARLFVAILENGLQADGSIKLPLALENYFGSTVIK